MDQSERTVKGILNLIDETKSAVAVFSENASDNLHDAQQSTRVGLDHLRTVAAFAADRAREMQARTEKMKVNSSELGDTSDALRAHFSRFDAIISETERVKKQLEADHAECKEYVPA